MTSIETEAMPCVRNDG